MNTRPPDSDTDNMSLQSELEKKFDGIRTLLSENRLQEAADVLFDIYDVTTNDRFKWMYDRTLDVLEDYMVRMVSVNVTHVDPGQLIEPACLIYYISPDMDYDLFFDLINMIYPPCGDRRYDTRLH